MEAVFNGKSLVSKNRRHRCKSLVVMGIAGKSIF